jgi:hypothetical protein
MLQEILTYLAIAWAVGYTLWQTVLLFRPEPKKTSAGCSAGCSNCNLKEIHQRILEKQKLPAMQILPGEIKIPKQDR